MERRTDDRIANMSGIEALPRKSGELVFHDRWERRVFAMAVALSEQGHYDWDEFRARLMASIAATGETPDSPRPDEPGYYEHWLASFEKLLEDKGILRQSDAGARKG